MNAPKTIEARIAGHYGELSDKLRTAADYVVRHPVEIATRSLRSVSAASGVSPATFSRLSRALGFDTYEDLRELSRSAVGRKVLSFSERAARLRSDESGDGAGASMLERQSGACVANIGALVQDIDAAALDRAVARLRGARQVLLFGALGSTGITEYMAYLARYFSDNWSLAGRMGASLGAELAAIGTGDVLLIVTKTPYVRRAVIAAQIAREAGATTLLVTDDHSCPALRHADHAFIVPSDSPQFFSSYAATLVLLETMIAMIIASSDEDASAHIRRVEERNRRLGEFWADEEPQAKHKGDPLC